MLRRIGIQSEVASRLFDIAILVFAVIGAGQLTLWAIDRAVPVTVHWRSVVHERVRPGEEFIYFNDFTRTKFCRTTVQRWIVDSTEARYDIESVNTGMPTEGLDVRQTRPAIIPVPKGIADGPAKSCFQSLWSCNPVQRYGHWPIVGPETCLHFTIDSTASPISYAPIGRVTLAETWP